jgi:hypothetical protein
LQTNKQSPSPPPSSPYITHKIRQICFIYKGRKPRNKKTKGAADNQQNARLCKAESRKPGFLDNKSSVHAPSGEVNWRASGEKYSENRRKTFHEYLTRAKQVKQSQAHRAGQKI